MMRERREDGGANESLALSEARQAEMSCTAA